MSISNNPNRPPLGAFEKLEKKGKVRLTGEGGVEVVSKNALSKQENTAAREAFLDALTQRYSGGAKFTEQLTSEKVLAKPLSTRKVGAILSDAAEQHKAEKRMLTESGLFSIKSLESEVKEPRADKSRNLQAFRDLKGDGPIKIKGEKLAIFKKKWNRPDLKREQKVKVREALYKAMQEAYPKLVGQFLPDIMADPDEPLTAKRAKELIAGLEFMALDNSEADVNSDDVGAVVIDPTAKIDRQSMQAFAGKFESPPDITSLTGDAYQKLDRLSNLVAGKAANGDLSEEQGINAAELTFALIAEDPDWKANLEKQFNEAVNSLTYLSDGRPLGGGDK